MAREAGQRFAGQSNSMGVAQGHAKRIRWSHRHGKRCRNFSAMHRDDGGFYITAEGDRPLLSEFPFHHRTAHGTGEGVRADSMVGNAT